MNQKLLFFGDSITQCGSSHLNPLGDGFVSMTARMLTEDPIRVSFDVINAGIGGDTIVDLINRYQSDVLPHFPEHIIVKIGINDADNDWMSGLNASRLIQFKRDYLSLLDQIFHALPEIRIALLTPYYISDNKEDALYQRMCAYGNIVKEIAAELSLPVGDTQIVFDDAVKLKPAINWADDHIHPGAEGHALLAEYVYNFLKEII